MALQLRLGVLSERRTGVGSPDLADPRADPPCVTWVLRFRRLHPIWETTARVPSIAARQFCKATAFFSAAADSLEPPR